MKEAQQKAAAEDVHETQEKAAAEDDIDAELGRRLSKPLKYYDGGSHRSMFALTKFQRDGLKSEDRINTDADPVFMV